MADPKRTADQFNTDPKHESDRAEFDKLVEGSLTRMAERKKQSNGGDQNKGEPSFLDGLLDAFFGGEAKK